MDDIESTLERWRSSLCGRVELASLIARNPTAHKWKATYRNIVLRELIFWRLHDLLSQGATLEKSNQVLGSRILLRSALETLAVLIYLNQRTEAVVLGVESFRSFGEITANLMLGSRDQSTKHISINILTILEKSNKKYPGLFDLYKSLSESAHPSYNGLCFGYSSVDEVNFTTVFENRWLSEYEGDQSDAIRLCITTFEEEYGSVWSELMERLEVWLEKNDPELAANEGAV